MDFQTPEEFFLNQPKQTFHWTNLDPSSVLASVPENKYSGTMPLVVKHQELIVMTGSPASGKSTFVKKVMVPAGYVRVNRDELKTKEKCVRVCKENLDLKKSVVIDNTNPSREDRLVWIKLAQERGIPVRCFVMQTTHELSLHLNIYREKMTNGETARLPEIAFNMFRTKFQGM